MNYNIQYTVHISQTTWLLDAYRLTNLSLRLAKASATSLIPNIFIYFAASSKVQNFRST